MLKILLMFYSQEMLSKQPFYITHITMPGYVEQKSTSDIKCVYDIHKLDCLGWNSLKYFFLLMWVKEGAPKAIHDKIIETKHLRKLLIEMLLFFGMYSSYVESFESEKDAAFLFLFTWRKIDILVEFWKQCLIILQWNKQKRNMLILTNFSLICERSAAGVLDLGIQRLRFDIQLMQFVWLKRFLRGLVGDEFFSHLQPLFPPIRREPLSLFSWKLFKRTAFLSSNLILNSLNSSHHSWDSSCQVHYSETIYSIS